MLIQVNIYVELHVVRQVYSTLWFKLSQHTILQHLAKRAYSVGINKIKFCFLEGSFNDSISYRRSKYPVHTCKAQNTLMFQQHFCYHFISHYHSVVLKTEWTPAFHRMDLHQTFPQHSLHTPAIILHSFKGLQQHTIVKLTFILSINVYHTSKQLSTIKL